MVDLELLTAENGVNEPEIELTDKNIPEDMAKEWENGKGDDE